jgi:murein DD-endopeptidase MepM/ murein hydrolase activator NlpD
MRGLSLVYADVSSGVTQKGYIPPSIFTQPDTESVSLVVHTVKRGETLPFLARKYHTNVSTLQILNRLQSAQVSPGQKLIIATTYAPSPEEKPLSTGVASVNRRPQPSSTTPSAKGIHFIWPLQGEISSSFGYRRGAMGGSRGNFHAGIDIRAPQGTPVRAAEDGEVVMASYFGGYGRVIILAHKNDFTTLYGHNSELLVRPGDRVKKGEVIALSGNTGRSTGPHLHFEIRKGETPFDPLRFLD